MLRLGVASLVIVIGVPCNAAAQSADWPAYGGDAGGMKYSPLSLVLDRPHGSRDGLLRSARRPR